MIRNLNSLLLAASAVSSVCGTDEPTSNPSMGPSTPIEALYKPGQLDKYELNLHLSHGLEAKVIARAGVTVEYADGSRSTEKFHEWPDGAAVFEDKETGGWIYVSNSEIEFGGGGVGAIRFDADGNVINYRMLLTGTERNCNGGKTDWGTWISAEEPIQSNGKVWEVDPFGEREPVQIKLGSQGGAWEAFAHDTRNESVMYAFLTEDSEDGALQRMTIENPNYKFPPGILQQGGEVHWLILEPNSFFERSSGKFYWTTNELEARANAALYYPNTEGMEMDGNTLCFISKETKGFYHLDLDSGNYTFESVGYAGQPDQSTTVFNHDGSKTVYLTEEAHPVMGFLGAQVGVWTLDEEGNYTCILWGDDYSSETTGIDFSPDGQHMYFAYQADGILFDVTRSDGLSFFSRKAAAEGDGLLPTGDDPAEGDSFIELVSEGLSNFVEWLGF